MNKIFKKVFALVIIVGLVLTVACSVNTEQNVDGDEAVKKVKMSIAGLAGPTGMGLVEMMDKNQKGETVLDYEFTIMGSPDELIGRIITGEVDVAAVPTNLALLLYNRTDGAVQLAAVNTLGVLYMIENGDSIQSMDDLKGKTVNTSGKGASPDYIFRYILEKKGLKVDEDVMLDYKLQHAELAAAMVAGDVDIALLPQPHVTSVLMRNEDIRIALDITEEWTKVTEDNGELAMGCIIVQKAFLEENKAAFNDFLKEYKQSINFVNNNVEEAAELIAKFEILPNALIAKNSIPFSNIVYIDAVEAKGFLEELFNILYVFDAKSVGGALADEGFYYKK